MPAPDALATMLAELDAMSPEDRAAILGALTRRERDLLDRLGRAMAGPAAHGTDLSPWLASHVHAARRRESAMTAAGAEAVLRAVGVPAREAPPAGRSLVGAFGGLLASRGAR